MKEKLLKLIEAKKAEQKSIREKIKASEDINEVRSLGETLDKIAEELKALEEMVANAEADEEAANEEGRNAFNPMGTYQVVGAPAQPAEKVDVRSTKEYHEQFRTYIRSGVMGDKLVKREATASVSTELGVLLPETTEKAFLEALKEDYGYLYNAVYKMNTVGGVKIPIASFAATYTRIVEGAVSERTKAGEVLGYVQFGYNIGELRLARTLLQALLAPETFDAAFGKLLAQAYAEGTDKEILKGDPAKNEMEGILTEAAKENNGRLKGHVIDFTAAEIADWTAWENKFFGILPVELENGAEFVMAKRTYVGNLCTLKDKNDQPINKAGFDVADKQYKFNEVTVKRVPETLFKSFDACANDEYFGMYWVGQKAYAINQNLQVSTHHYFDHETNQYVDKMIFINDGKILDPEYIYLLRKKVSA